MYKEMLANTINELNDMPKGMSDCYSFGIVWGCKPECPVFKERKCELQEELEEEWEREDNEYE